MKLSRWLSTVLVSALMFATSFPVSVANAVAPTASTLCPIDGAIDVGVASNLTIRFSANVRGTAVTDGTNGVALYKTSGNMFVEAFTTNPSDSRLV